MPDNQLPIVIVHPAFRWECLVCKRENFDRAKTVEFLDPDEELATKEALGIPEGIEGAVLEASDSVTCLQCLAMYRTTDEGEPV